MPSSGSERAARAYDGRVMRERTFRIECNGESHRVTLTEAAKPDVMLQLKSGDVSRVRVLFPDHPGEENPLNTVRADKVLVALGAMPTEWCGCYKLAHSIVEGRWYSGQTAAERQLLAFLHGLSIGARRRR